MKKQYVVALVIGLIVSVIVIAAIIGSTTPSKQSRTGKDGIVLTIYYLMNFIDHCINIYYIIYIVIYHFIFSIST